MSVSKRSASARALPGPAAAKESRCFRVKPGMSEAAEHRRGRSVQHRGKPPFSSATRVGRSRQGVCCDETHNSLSSDCYFSGSAICWTGLRWRRQSLGHRAANASCETDTGARPPRKLRDSHRFAVRQDGTAGEVYAGEQTANGNMAIRRPTASSQYDVACVKSGAWLGNATITPKLPAFLYERSSAWVSYPMSDGLGSARRFETALCGSNSP